MERALRLAQRPVLQQVLRLAWRLLRLAWRLLPVWLPLAFWLQA